MHFRELLYGGSADFYFFAPQEHGLDVTKVCVSAVGSFAVFYPSPCVEVLKHHTVDVGNLNVTDILKKAVHVKLTIIKCRRLSVVGHPREMRFDKFAESEAAAAGRCSGKKLSSFLSFFYPDCL